MQSITSEVRRERRHRLRRVIDLGIGRARPQRDAYDLDTRALPLLRDQRRLLWQRREYAEPSFRQYGVDHVAQHRGGQDHQPLGREVRKLSGAGQQGDADPFAARSGRVARRRVSPPPFLLMTTPSPLAAG